MIEMHVTLTARSRGAACRPAAHAAAVACTPANDAAEGKALCHVRSHGIGRQLARDGLRSGAKQQGSPRLRRHRPRADKAALDGDCAAIVKVRQSLTAEHVQVDQRAGAAAGCNIELDAHSAQIEDWNERFKRFMDANRSGPMAERRRAELEREKEALQRNQRELDELKASIGCTADAVKAYNQRAADMDRRAAEWNARNDKLVDSGQALQNERTNWQGDCGDRRYREDDEMAIKRGQ